MDIRYAYELDHLIPMGEINEKGVGIGVLTLDSEPTLQNTGKPVLATTILIRPVLDRAASTQETIDLIAGYDAFAAAGRDYHFFITDSTGDSRIVEYDCDDPGRKMTATPTKAATGPISYCIVTGRIPTRLEETCECVDDSDIDHDKRPDHAKNPDTKQGDEEGQRSD